MAAKPRSNICFLLQLLLIHNLGKSQLQLNFYSNSCPKAEEIIKQQVIQLYNEHGNYTAVSWVRNLFHDCIVKSCDASLLLATVSGVVSEQTSERSFGMRNFKYVNTIKVAVEKECPLTVSCADIVALSARDDIAMLGGPSIEMKSGRRDSRESYATVVEDFVPNHNDSMSLVLSRFQAIGIDVEATVALLGAHSVGRVHCMNMVQRLYPSVDETLNPAHAAYKNILQHKGLLTVDELHLALTQELHLMYERWPLTMDTFTNNSQGPFCSYLRTIPSPEIKVKSERIVATSMPTRYFGSHLYHPRELMAPGLICKI